MKYLLYLVLIAGTAYQLNAATVNQLKNAYVKKLRDLRAFLLSVEGNRQSAEVIVAAQKKIRSLEQQNGISDINQKISALRIESCKIQQENPDAKKILDELESVAKKIKRVTAPERKKIEALTDQKNGQNKEAQKRLESKIKEIEKQMQNKTRPDLKKINDLNDQLYDVDDIRSKLDEVGPLAKQVAAKYKSLSTELDPLDKQIAESTKAIQKRIEPQQAKFKKLREDIHKLRKLIVQKDPCFSAKESALPQRWENLLA